MRVSESMREVAHSAVKKAVAQGTLTRPERCARCGRDVGAKNIAAHHEDYSKPLDVVWLCRNCHGRAEHPREGRFGGRAK